MPDVRPSRPDRLLLPLPGVLEFGEAEAGEGFAFAGEKLLHQPFFMGLERVQFPALGGDQLVQRSSGSRRFFVVRRDDGERQLRASEIVVAIANDLCTLRCPSMILQRTAD